MNKNKIEIVESEKEPVKIATIIGIITVVLNLLFGITKIIIGKVISSSAVFSDGIHGTGDVLTTIIAVISVWIAAKKKNKKYNYGYERYASITCVILSILLFVTAFEIIVESSENLLNIFQNNENESLEAYSTLWWISFSLSLASIILKIVMFFITMYGAKKAHSKAMQTDAWHQIIDALSSIAAIIALLGYIWLDKNYLDPIFTYPIAIMVIMVGVETLKQATKELTDHAIDKDKLEEVKNIIKEIVPENQIKMINSRIFSEKFYLDIYILEDENMTLKESDAISDKIKKELFSKFDDLKNAYVIIEPNNEEHRIQLEGR